MNFEQNQQNLLYYLLQTRNSINYMLTHHFNYPEHYYNSYPYYHQNTPYTRNHTTHFRHTRNNINNLLNVIEQINRGYQGSTNFRSSRGRSFMNPQYDSDSNTDTSPIDNDTSPRDINSTSNSNYNLNFNPNSNINNNSQNISPNENITSTPIFNSSFEINSNSLGNLNSTSPHTQNLRNRIQQILPELVEITLYRENRDDNTDTSPGNMEDVIVPTDLHSLRNNSTVDLYQNIDTEFDKCCICRDTLMNSDIIRKINHCGHVFHMNCLDTWLETNTMCPICRCDIRSNNTETEQNNTD